MSARKRPRGENPGPEAAPESAPESALAAGSDARPEARPDTPSRDVGADGMVEVFTDGACSGNPGPGGWGAMLRWKGHERELHGGERWTTNNRMELMAAIRALEALKRPAKVRLTTDSRYLRDGITSWIRRWKRNGWKTADKKPVKNVDLWQRLDAALARHEVSFHWIKGHAGHPENERADRLARRGIEESDSL